MARAYLWTRTRIIDCSYAAVTQRAELASLSSAEPILHFMRSFWRRLARGGTAVWQSNIGWKSVLRVFSASNACFARDEPRLVALDLPESRQSYVRGAALSREPQKLEQA